MKNINLKALGIEIDNVFRYVAVDKDGDIYAYEDEPFYSHALGQWLTIEGGAFELIKNGWDRETFNFPANTSLFRIDNGENDKDSLCKVWEENFSLISNTLNRECAEKDSLYFLNKATETQSSRAGEYDTVGEKERNMQKIVDMFNSCTGKSLTEAEGYLFMECLKNVRLFNAPDFHEDSAVDGVSYSSLKAEAKAREHGL